jgi:propanol-preferring alcohol dehydrogenase
MRVIAVDIADDKLATAKELGADECVNADKNAGAAIKALGGAHGCVNFETVTATLPMMLDA